MSGTLQADFLQPQSNAGLSILNPSGNTVMASINSAGIFSSTGSLLVANTGNVFSTGNVTASGVVTASNVTASGVITSNTLTSNTLVLTGSTSGSVSLVAPAVSGTNTATLPAATGTVMVSGAMPAFSAYATTGQSLTTSIYQKINFGATSFDTASAFNTSTSRFVAPIAGYYQVNHRGGIGGSGVYYPNIYKNGSNYLSGSVSYYVSGIDNTGSISTIMQLAVNDYIEIYAYVNTAATSTYTRAATDFSAVLVRTL